MSTISSPLCQRPTIGVCGVSFLRVFAGRLFCPSAEPAKINPLKTRMLQCSHKCRKYRNVCFVIVLLLLFNVEIYVVNSAAKTQRISRLNRYFTEQKKPERVGRRQRQNVRRKILVCYKGYTNRRLTGDKLQYRFVRRRQNPPPSEYPSKYQTAFR